MTLIDQRIIKDGNSKRGVMLNDSQMSKLAEMCGWADYPSDGRAYADYRRLTQGPMAYTAFKQDYWQLTLAGYFVVIGRLDLHVKPSEHKKGWVAFFRNDVWYRTGPTLPAAIDAALQEIL